MIPARLYTVCLSELPTGAKVAQTGHVVAEYAHARPDAFRAWKLEGQYLICLQADDLVEVSNMLIANGHDLVHFFEPDLDGQMTAIAVDGSARKLLSSLRLAK